MDSFTLFRKRSLGRTLGHGALCLAIAAGIFATVPALQAGSGKSSSALLAPPTVNITGQPKGTTVCEGQDVTLTVNAVGSPNTELSYQWRRGNSELTEGTKYIGTKTATLTIKNFTAADAANNYNVVITAETLPKPGQTTSSISDFVSVTLKQTTLITQQIVSTNPLDTGFCENTPFTIKVVAQGTGLTYQWFKDNVLLPNETKAALAIQNATSANAGNYYVKVVGDCGMDSSKVANVRVFAPTAISAQPLDLNICEGTQLSLDVTAAGENLQYSWTKQGLNNPVSLVKNFTKTATVTDAGNYTVRVVGTCGEEVSRTAKVTIMTKPSFRTDLSGGQAVLRVGLDSAMLIVSATGTGPLTYQWKLDGQAIPGATDSSLKIVPFTSANKGKYTVDVTNGCATVTSKPFDLLLSSIDDIRDNGYALMIANPNPVMDVAYLGFTVPAAQHARLVVTDLTGREVAVLFDGIAEANVRNEVKLNIAEKNIPAGMYFYTLTAGSFRATQTISVVR